MVGIVGQGGELVREEWFHWVDCRQLPQHFKLLKWGGVQGQLVQLVQQQLLVLLELSLFFRVVSFLQECHGGAEAWACSDEDEKHAHGKERDLAYAAGENFEATDIWPSWMVSRKN